MLMISRIRLFSTRILHKSEKAMTHFYLVNAILLASMKNAIHINPSFMIFAYILYLK